MKIINYVYGTEDFTYIIPAYLSWSKRVDEILKRDTPHVSGTGHLKVSGIT